MYVKKWMIGGAVMLVGITLGVTSTVFSQTGMTDCVACTTDHTCEMFGSECWSRGTGEDASEACGTGTGMCEAQSGDCGALMVWGPFFGCTLPSVGCGGTECFDWIL